MNPGSDTCRLGGSELVTPESLFSITKLAPHGAVVSANALFYPDLVHTCHLLEATAPESSPTMGVWGQDVPSA